ncbi:hypothetical protein LI169_16615, partial [Desulfovibrio desulfuricans]|nr:hypothetical protein [Desulfovibrio desulfuricans]
GHYAFNDAEVKKELQTLYENLAKHHIDGQRFVVDHIKRPLQQYAECYNLKGITSRVRSIIEYCDEAGGEIRLLFLLACTMRAVM